MKAEPAPGPEAKPRAYEPLAPVPVVAIRAEPVAPVGLAQWSPLTANTWSRGDSNVKTPTRRRRQVSVHPSPVAASVAEQRPAVVVPAAAAQGAGVPRGFRLVERAAEPSLIPPNSHTTEATFPHASAEDVHDEFFSAGETGSYHVASHAAEEQHGFDDLGADSGRRVVERTPEQEARRERNIKIVSALVGVGLAMACVALWRSHRAGQSSTEVFAPNPSAQVNAETTPSAAGWSYPLRSTPRSQP